MAWAPAMAIAHERPCRVVWWLVARSRMAAWGPALWSELCHSLGGRGCSSGLLRQTWPQVVYILDQVRALEREMLARIAAQGLNIVPRILVITRLIPDAEVLGLLPV